MDDETAVIILSLQLPDSLEAYQEQERMAAEEVKGLEDVNGFNQESQGY